MIGCDVEIDTRTRSGNALTQSGHGHDVRIVAAGWESGVIEPHRIRPSTAYGYQILASQYFLQSTSVN
jgi:hypothetical protein